VGLDALRGVTWWAFAIPPVLAATLPPRRTPEREERTPVNLAFAAALVVTALAFAPWWRSSETPGGSSSLLRDDPPGITRALSGIVTPGTRIFNAQSWGSWLEFAFPSSLVAVDSRIEVFPASVWQTYGDVSAGRQGWQQTLRSWNVDLVIASRGQQSRLLPLIAGDPGWHLVYSDRDGAIYERVELGTGNA